MGPFSVLLTGPQLSKLELWSRESRPMTWRVRVMASSSVTSEPHLVPGT